jgi:hypothetical protein
LELRRAQKEVVWERWVFEVVQEMRNERTKWKKEERSTNLEMQNLEEKGARIGLN